MFTTTPHSHSATQVNEHLDNIGHDDESCCALPSNCVGAYCWGADFVANGAGEKAASAAAVLPPSVELNVATVRGLLLLMLLGGFAGLLEDDGPPVESPCFRMLDITDSMEAVFFRAPPLSSPEPGVLIRSGPLTCVVGWSKSKSIASAGAWFSFLR